VALLGKRTTPQTIRPSGACRISGSNIGCFTLRHSNKEHIALGVCVVIVVGSMHTHIARDGRVDHCSHDRCDLQRQPLIKIPFHFILHDLFSFDWCVLSEPALPWSDQRDMHSIVLDHAIQLEVLAVG